MHDETKHVLETTEGVIEITTSCVGTDHACGFVSKSLVKVTTDLCSCHTDTALNTLESLVLAHAVAGVDVTNEAYIEGVNTTLDAIANM